MTPFESARAEERLNRLLAYLPLAPRLCGCPVVPITARHLLELELAGSPFIVGGRVDLNAVLALLWRLHPDFRRPTGEMPNLERGRPRPSRLACWLAQRRIARQLARRSFNLAAAIAEIKSRLAACYQDQAAAVEDGRGLRSPLAPDRHWIESFFEFYCGACGWSKEGVLDSSLASLFQIYREHCLARGDDTVFIAPSDSLIGPAS